MKLEYQKIRNTAKDGESTDDEIIEEEINRIFDGNKSMIRDPSYASKSAMGLDRLETEAQENKNDVTLAYVAKSQNFKGQEDENDKDYDFSEFIDAEVEEAEDRIYSEYKKQRQMGKPLAPEMIQELAGDVNLNDCNQSIIMSARAG